MRLYLVIFIALLKVSGFCQGVIILNNISELDSLENRFRKRNDVGFIILNIPNLKKMPDQMKVYDQITTLSIYSDSFEELPDWINSLNKLEYVFLTGKNFNLKNIFNSLSSLNIKYLELQEIDSQLPLNISDLKNLENLKIYNSKIDSLPEEISKIYSLKYLTLSGNNIKETDKLFTKLGELPLLEDLVLFENNLDSISSNIYKLKNLKTFRLSGSKIISLPESISNLSNLEYLHLICENFISFPKGLTKLKKLTKVSSYSESSRAAMEFMKVQMPWCIFDVRSLKD